MDGLRDYQNELLKRTEDALQPTGARVMLQLPTGGGKTHIAGVLLSRWLRDGCKAAWLTHLRNSPNRPAGCWPTPRYR